MTSKSEMTTCEKLSVREAEKRRCKERIRRALKTSKSSGWDDRDYSRETMEILREAADSPQALIQRGKFKYVLYKIVSESVNKVSESSPTLEDFILLREIQYDDTARKKSEGLVILCFLS